MASLIIHRGTREIGGSAVEINNQNTRLLFDFGIPLESLEEKKWKIEDYKLNVKGLYKDEEPQFDAVFLTHAHPDHYGLIQLINPEIPIYMSKTTYDILDKIVPLLSKQNIEDLNLKIIDDEIHFKDIKIKIHLVDHSIAGASAYEIDVDNKKIVYSGDIRFHGRTSYLSSNFKRKLKEPDYLIMEGTTLGRTEQKIITEKDLEPKFIEIFKNGKLPLVQFSPQNIDRFVTVYRASKRAGKTLVIDPYTAHILEIYSSLSKSIPQYNWENIRVNFAYNRINNELAKEKILYKYKKKKITIDEIIKEPEKYVIKSNWSINKQLFDKISHDNIEIVFSMWRGYLDRPNQFDDYKDIKITPLHTSGHAYLEDLQKLVNTMNPKNLIPIHTEYKDKYQKLFKTKIITLNDGEVLKLYN